MRVSKKIKIYNSKQQKNYYLPQIFEDSINLNTENNNNVVY
jgi:hypothetical protein